MGKTVPAMPFTQNQQNQARVTNGDQDAGEAESAASGLIDVVRVNPEPLATKKILREGLDLDYIAFFGRRTANYIFQRLESEVEYFTGDLLKIRVYGKWHKIPRKQVSYGDPGMSYAFSGSRLPAKPWTPLLEHLRGLVSVHTGHQYNFVLVNRHSFQVQRWLGSHWGAPRRRKGPGLRRAYCVALVRASTGLRAEARGCTAQSASGGTSEDKPGAWESAADEPSDEPVLVPLPPSSQGCPGATHQPYLSSTPHVGHHRAL